MRHFPKKEIGAFKVFKKLDTPAKVQDFLNGLGVNFERKGETCRSPLEVLRRREAHCMEGALLAAAIFWYHGREPLLMNLATTDDDTGHVLALYKEEKRWGAVTKTNHAVLRYRDPVYASPRELAMSYFHEYFKDSGKKTMRAYSTPMSLLRFKDGWLTAKEDLWHIDKALLASRHISVAPQRLVRKLRKADPIERKAGKLTEY